MHMVWQWLQNASHAGDAHGVAVAAENASHAGDAFAFVAVVFGWRRPQNTSRPLASKFVSIYQLEFHHQLWDGLSRTWPCLLS